MSEFEVPEAILNSAFAAPSRYWYIRRGHEPEMREGRRPSVVYPPDNTRVPWELGDVLRLSVDFAPAFEMTLVNRIRERLAQWRRQNYAGASRVTLELLQWWKREGRQQPLFYAQIEAVETIIFLNEGRGDLLQGVNVPSDEPTEQQLAAGAKAFMRYACKMATGSGKTTVMGMLAAWSILNKVNDPNNAKYSDVVLIVCPNVTIKNRLAELEPKRGDASLYRTRDLVPAHLMPDLMRGRLLVMNWHVFALHDPNQDGLSARVRRNGVEQKTTELIHIGEKNATARGKRYLTEEELQRQIGAGLLTVVAGGEERDPQGLLKKVKVEGRRYVESDAAWIKRVIGQEIGGKKNLMVFNDEAHHAYRIRQRIEEEGAEDEDALFDDEDAEEWDNVAEEATVWMEGLDRIHRMRGINFCLDLSATPYFLARVGRDTNKPFPWVVSDFPLSDAIESGLVKIPQLAVRDNTGREVPGFRNIWKWVLEKMTPRERGGKLAQAKPEAVLKYAHTPIAMLGGHWEDMRREWAAGKDNDPRPPVFILVCKNTKVAKVVYEWLAEDKPPGDVAPAKLAGFRNVKECAYSIRVDTKVVHESDSGAAKADEVRWMRATLDTVGKITWPTDSQGRPVYPEGFEELATKLKRPLHPPGRDVRCIVSVGMLTEGWDCNTVTHVVGLRPFMSQLLCEQVVGRGLRRKSYDVDEKTGMFKEEVAKVFGVPFEVIPFKANPQGTAEPKPDRHHVHAVPSKRQYRIAFPRVEGYTQAVRNWVTVDWDNPQAVPPLELDPMNIPPEVQVKGAIHSADGRPTLTGPGKLEDLTLNPYRQGRRVQELVFDLARGLTRSYMASGHCEVPAHALFPQLVQIVDRYLREKVVARPPAEKVDVFCSPYYGWVVERLTGAIHGDKAQGEAAEVPRYEANRGPGSTDDVSYWTTRTPNEAIRTHLNYVVPDTALWEQSAAYFIDGHAATDAFVKNAGLEFAIPYLHNGESHDYVPDFIVRLKTTMAQPERHLILETKGRPDPMEAVKTAAAERWVNAVNADGRYGVWAYKIARRPEDVRAVLTAAARG